MAKKDIFCIPLKNKNGLLLIFLKAIDLISSPISSLIFSLKFTTPSKKGPLVRRCLPKESKESTTEN